MSWYDIDGCSTQPWGSILNRSEAGRLGGLASVPIWRAKCLAAREQYDANPKLCIHCGKPIPFLDRLKNRFCSHRCAAKVVSAFVKIKPGPPRTTPYCEVCDKPHKVSGQRCRSCEQERLIVAGKVHTRGTLRKWLLRKRGHSCERCHTTEWMGEKVPLEIDHVDGNAGHNNPENLRLLCPNCHAQMPTSKGRNRGNGRTARGLPKQ